MLLGHRVQCRRGSILTKVETSPAPDASPAPGTGGVGLAWLPVGLGRARAPGPGSLSSRPRQLVLRMLEEGRGRTWPLAVSSLLCWL